MDSGIVIGILTALPRVELPAVLRAFDLDASSECHEMNDGERYWLAPMQTANGEKVTVVISCVGMAGNTESSLPTDRMIRKYSPELMILCGIGCGIRRFALGDVATSGAIWAYEYLKTTTKGPLDRSRARVAPFHVQDDVAFFSRIADWHALVSRCMTSIEPSLQPKQGGFAPSLHRGVWIASGEKVLADGELAQLNEAHDLICAGEMEGYGFAVACEDRRPPIPWLVARGVSDYGDSSKDGGSTPGTPRKDEYHHAAAQAAAAFARVFVGHGYTATHRAQTPGVASHECAGNPGLALEREGLRTVFTSDYDPAFGADLLSRVSSAAKSVILAGMGLSFLKGNTELIGAIVTALQTSPQLSVEIYYGDPLNPGIRNRVREEARESARQGTAYTKTWPKDHSDSILKALRSKLRAADYARLSFRLTDCLPMVSIIRVDDAFVWYPYGTPNIRGKQSPWILMERTGTATTPPLIRFLEESLSYYKRTSGKNILSPSSTGVP